MAVRHLCRLYDCRAPAQVGQMLQGCRTYLCRKRYGVLLLLVSAFLLASRAAWIISLIS